MASVQAEVRELVDAIRSGGFQCAIERDGHWHVYRHGRPVLREHGGPVTLPSSPSDARWRENTITMLRDAKVLSVDPRKEDQIRLAKRDPELHQLREDMRQRMEPRTPTRPGRPVADERTKLIRARVVAALEQLGDTRAEFVRFAIKVGKSKGMKVWGSEASGQQVMFDLIQRDLRVSRNSLDLLEAALAEIGAAPVEAPPTTEAPPVAETKEPKTRRPSAQDPRLPDLRIRIKALDMNVPQFVAAMNEEGKKAGIRTTANQKAGEIGTHRILKGGGAKTWVVELLAVAVDAIEKRAPAPAAQVPTPEPTPTPDLPPTPEPAPDPEPVLALTNGSVAHVTEAQLWELVTLAHAQAKLENLHPDDAAAIRDLVSGKVEQLAAA